MNNLNNPWSGRRVLITGAAGFLGASLARAFLEWGSQVHVTLRPQSPLWRLNDVIPRLTVHTLDLADFQAVQTAVRHGQPEIIIHAAVGRRTATAEERRTTLLDNVMGLFNLLEATASLKYRRFIHLASSLEYGPRNHELSETDPLDPLLFFGATKAASSILCRQFARAQGRPVVVLRLFSVYGPWEAPTRLVPTAFMAALRREKLPLTVPGYRRDFVFSEDVVEACRLAADTNAADGQVLNIGSGQQWSNEDMVQLIQEVCGVSIDTRAGAYGAHPSDTSHWVANNRRAAGLLGWKPRHSLREGLEITLEWFRNHMDLYERPRG